MLELLGIMLAVASPIIVIVFIKQYFSYKKKISAEFSELKKEFDLLNNEELTRQVDNLQERIKVLETIVTDKGYEVTEKIANLK